MRRLRILWYDFCTAVSLMFIRMAGERPVSRLEQLLQKEKLSESERMEMEQLLPKDDVVITR